FFQAEDGIRDWSVTGVQTCALPISRMIQAVSPDRWDRLQRVLPRELRRPSVGEKLHKLSRVMACDEDGLYEQLVSHWPNPCELVIGSKEPGGIRVDRQVLSSMHDSAHRMQ